MEYHWSITFQCILINTFLDILQCILINTLLDIFIDFMVVYMYDFIMFRDNLDNKKKTMKMQWCYSWHFALLLPYFTFYSLLAMLQNSLETWCWSFLFSVMHLYLYMTAVGKRSCVVSLHPHMVCGFIWCARPCIHNFGNNDDYSVSLSLCLNNFIKIDAIYEPLQYTSLSLIHHFWEYWGSSIMSCLVTSLYLYGIV